MLSYILDQSHWNGRCYIPVAKQAGAVASFIRFGSINNSTGICYEDFAWRDNVVNAEYYDFPYGAYWYMRPKFSGVLQGNFLVSLLKDAHPKLPIMIDVEEQGDYKNIISMFEVVRKAGYKTTLYTRQTIWDYSFPANPYWDTIDLHAARWTSDPLTSPWEDKRFVFRDFPTWKYWQFDADGNARAKEFGFPGYPVGDNDVDLSYYNGTLEQFIAEYNLDNTYPVGSYQVVTSGLYIRENPYIGAKILGSRQSGEIVVPIEHGGGDHWVKDEKGWSAVTNGGRKYMDKVS